MALETFLLTTFKDHARCDMQKRAMLLLKEANGRDVTEYAPIAKALCTINEDTERRMS